MIIPIYSKGPHVSGAICSVLAPSFSDYGLLVLEKYQEDLGGAADLSDGVQRVGSNNNGSSHRCVASGEPSLKTWWS